MRAPSLQSGVWVLALWLVQAGCVREVPSNPAGRQATAPAQESPMDMDPKEFLDVPLNVNQQHRCSPSNNDPRWRGVLIRAPSQVWFKEGERVGDYGAFAAIPICGYFHKDIKLGPPPGPMKLVAVDKRSKQVFSGPIIELDPSPEEPPPFEQPVLPQQVQGMSGGGYFNPNLADYVQLPHTSATYDVHIEYEGMKSNTVTIELIKE